MAVQGRTGYWWQFRDGQDIGGSSGTGWTLVVVRDGQDIDDSSGTDRILVAVQGRAGHWWQFRDGPGHWWQFRDGWTLVAVQGRAGHWWQFRDGQDIDGSSIVSSTKGRDGVRGI
jgi:hypothetical protein